MYNGSVSFTTPILYAFGFIGLFTFFFLMIRLLPRSTLFPYTTLFRSAGVGDMEHPGEGKRHLLPIDDDHVDDGHLLLNLLNYSDNRGTFFRDDDKTCRSFYTDNVSLDRKSTRLNSSHANISYAVFCLK